MKYLPAIHALPNRHTGYQIIGCMLLFIFSSYVNAQWQTDDAAIMGTTIRVEVWHEDENVRQQGVDEVMAEMERVNRLMSPYIEQSQLSKINKYAHEGPVEIDQDLFELIEKSQEVSRLTNGAFDITYALSLIHI